MPSDEEFRRVAEDLRGLARSLTRDLREAADRIKQQSRAGWTNPHQPWGDWRSHSWDAPTEPRAPTDGAGGEAGEGSEGPSSADAPPGSAPPWMPYSGWNPDWQWRDYRRSTRRGRHNGPRNYGATPYGPAPSATAPGEPASAGGAPPGWVGRATMAPPPPTPRPKRQRPPLRHRHDGSTLVGALALVFGLAWLASRTHLASVSTEVVLAVALMILGGTMVVTARTDWALSRRAWPALLGAGLVIAAIATSPSLGVPTDWNDLRIGAHTVQFSEWSSLPATYRGGIGKTTIDLSALPVPAPEDHHVDVTATVGQLVILLPPHVHAVVDAEMAAGDIQINGQDVDNGIRPKYHEVFSPEATGGTLFVHAKSGPGNLHIETRDPYTANIPPRPNIKAAPSVPSPPGKP